MPFIGSLTSNGEEVIGSSTASQEWYQLTIPAGAANSTQPLRVENLSRVSVMIRTSVGGVGCFAVLQGRVSNVFYDMQTVNLAAAGSTVNLEQHIALKDVRVSIVNPQGGFTVVDMLIMATGTS